MSLSALATITSIFLPCILQGQMVSPADGQTSSSNEPGITATQHGQGSSLAITAIPYERPAQKGGRPAGYKLWKHPGISVHVGVNGAGLDIAEPIAEHFNVRVGGQYMQYTGHFTSDGAQIDASLQLGNGKAGVDWFPFHNGFHISPQVFFAIQTQVKGAVIVPAGQSITLSGGDYVSSATDPLRGTAFIDTRKSAPGLTIGYGNLSPRSGAHWSFPVEAGFYYIGQPNLTVTFTGSACDPTQPPAIGCQSVNNDAGFQRDLARFIARNKNNLSYASFFPVASFGVGYRF